MTRYTLLGLRYAPRSGNERDAGADQSVRASAHEADRLPSQHLPRCTHRRGRARPRRGRGGSGSPPLRSTWRPLSRWRRASRDGRHSLPLDADPGLVLDLLDIGLFAGGDPDPRSPSCAPHIRSSGRRTRILRHPDPLRDHRGTARRRRPLVGERNGARGPPRGLPALDPPYGPAATHEGAEAARRGVRAERGRANGAARTIDRLQPPRDPFRHTRRSTSRQRSPTCSPCA